jgi:hypothetical protein
MGNKHLLIGKTEIGFVDPVWEKRGGLWFANTVHLIRDKHLLIGKTEF